ncbi:hypothetical protein BC332_33624 [Capsicum chinense]|nr:hypothetical protein BC332_33624 [Capsicum chinense]
MLTNTMGDAIRQDCVGPLFWDTKRRLIKGISIGGCVFWPHRIVRNSIIVYFDGKSNEPKELPMPDFVDRASTIIYFDMKSDEVKKLSSPNFITTKALFCLDTSSRSTPTYGTLQTLPEYRAISCPDNHLNYNEEPRRVSACGLCYDSSVGDYKVILIYDLFYAVYSLIRDSWTTKTSFPCPVLPLLPGDLISFGISTAGCVFWSLINGKIQLFVDRASTIIYFDVKSDGVKNLSTPDFVGENDFFYLASVKGCLSLYGGRIESKELNIWIMEQDGSWKWLMNICNLPYICKTFVQDRELLGCTRNGDIVFQGWPCCRIFIYYPRQQLLTETELSSKDLPIASLCLDSLYSPSLNVKHKRKRQSDMMFN